VTRQRGELPAAVVAVAGLVQNLDMALYFEARDLVTADDNGMGVHGGHGACLGQGQPRGPLGRNLGRKVGFIHPGRQALERQLQAFQQHFAVR